jgi:Ca2+-binding RTX toxin-like protein
MGHATNATSIGDITHTGAGIFSMTAAAATAVGQVSSSGATGTTTVVLSNTTAIGTVMTGGAGIDNFTGTGGNDIITGAAGADVLIGASGNDTITGGEGIDAITGSTGIDSIVLTETTAVADNVTLFATAVAGSVSDYDLITSFTVGGTTSSDNIVALDADFAWFNGATDGAVVLATGTTMNALHAASNNFTVGTISTNVATHTFATFLAGASTIAELEAAIGTALGAATDASFANTDFVLIAIDDGVHTGLVRVVSAGNGDVIGLAELSLIGIVSGLTDATTLVAADFLFA